MRVDRPEIFSFLVFSLPRSCSVMACGMVDRVVVVESWVVGEED